MAYSTINKSTSFFDTHLYDSTGSPITISGLNFQPSLVWTKMRSGNDTTSHAIVDQVRGGTEKIFTDMNNAETTDADAVTAWTSDGYTFGISGSFQNGSNPYVHWCWKANGAGSADDSGTAPTATVSADTTSGFSITEYTTGSVGAGITVPHGLGVTPDLIIFKKLSGTGNPTMYHKKAGGYLYINTNAAVTSNSTWVTATSSLVTLAETWELYNNASSTYVMYCFNDVAGYSKFGSYTGTGSAGGPFVHLGFKPKFVLIKNTGATQEWVMFDNKRIGYNTEGNEKLYPDLPNAEADISEIDLVSNGFKLRTGGNQANQDGNTMVYMAFGQTIVGTNNTPATAR